MLRLVICCDEQQLWGFSFVNGMQSNDLTKLLLSIVELPFVDLNNTFPMMIPIHGRQNQITSRRIIFVTILVLVCSNFLELYGTILFCFWCTEMCGVQLNDRKRSKDLMWMLGLIVTTEQCSLVWS